MNESPALPFADGSREKVVDLRPSYSGEIVLLLEAWSWKISAAGSDFPLRGVGREALLGRSLTQVFPLLAESRVLPVLEEACRTGRRRRLEALPLTSGGETGLLYDLELRPFGTLHGSAPQVLLLARPAAGGRAFARTGDDLTRGPNRGPQRLEELAEIIDGFPDGVLLVDATGGFLYANSFFCRLFEIDALEAREADYPHLVELLDCRDLDGGPLEVRSHPITRALEGEDVPEEEIVLTRPGGERHLTVYVRCLKDRDQSLAGAVFIARDVTAWVEGQERLREAVRTERRRSSQLRLFNQLMMTLSSESDEGRLLDEVIRGAMRLTGAMEGYVYLLEQGNLHLEAFSSAARWAPRPASPEGRALVSRALEEGRSLRCSAGGDEPRDDLAAPIVGAEGAAIGCLLLSGRSAEAGFSADDEVFVSNVAAHLSVAIQNLRRIAHERQVALYLQRSMLPRIVEVPGLEVEFSYRSASDASLVGGDFYDLIPLSSGRAAFVVGDVCGKGLAAATQTAKARYIFRAYATFGYDPGRWLQAVHDALRGNLNSNEFVTAALVIVDPETGEMEYGLAGHPPPVIVASGGVRELKGEPGLPLGAAPKGGYRTHREDLETGETLLLYTDGLFEARRGPHLFGLERLPEAVRRLFLEPVGLGCRRLIEEAQDYAGGRLADDVVVGAVRRRTQRRRLPPPAR